MCNVAAFILFVSVVQAHGSDFAAFRASLLDPSKAQPNQQSQTRTYMKQLPQHQREYRPGDSDDDTALDTRGDAKSRVMRRFTKEIKELGQKGMYEEAIQKLEEMRKIGLPPNVITFNAVISACEKSSQAGRALQIFDEMRIVGPNVITFNTLISACARRKDKYAGKAESLYFQMEDKRVEPNKITFNALINSQTDLEKIDEIFNDMKAKNIEPDVITYNALITAFAENREEQRALGFFEGMQQEGLVPDVVTYNAVISACEKGDRFDKALEIFAKMQQGGVKPDRNTYGFMIKACTRAGWHERASEFRKTLEELGSEVQVMGLSSEAGKKLNGQIGKIVSKDSSGRVVVEFADGVQKALKPDNLCPRTKIPEGTRVQVMGLASAIGQALNGQFGKVISQDKSGRLLVEFQDGHKKALKPENLATEVARDPIPQRAPPPAEPPPPQEPPPNLQGNLPVDHGVDGGLARDADGLPGGFAPVSKPMNQPPIPQGAPPPGEPPLPQGPPPDLQGNLPVEPPLPQGPPPDLQGNLPVEPPLPQGSPPDLQGNLPVDQSVNGGLASDRAWVQSVTGGSDGLPGGFAPVSKPMNQPMDEGVNGGLASDREWVQSVTGGAGELPGGFAPVSKPMNQPMDEAGRIPPNVSKAQPARSTKRKFDDGAQYVMVSGLLGDQGQALNGQIAKVISEDIGGDESRWVVQLLDGKQEAVPVGNLQKLGKRSTQLIALERKTSIVQDLCLLVDAIALMALVSLLSGSGVTFAVLCFHCSPSSVREEPLLV